MITPSNSRIHFLWSRPSLEELCGAHIFSKLDLHPALFHHVFRNYGIPEDIASNRGPQFISHVWKAFLKLLGISVSLSSGYHPQTNGQTKRKIQKIGRYLWAYCHDNQHSWNHFLPWAEYAQNSLRQTTMGLTTFQCILAYQPPLFPWTGEPSDAPAVDHWFWVSERVWDSAHVHLQQAVRRRKDFADARQSHVPVYRPGEFRSDSRPGICISACPAGSWVPAS